MNSRPSISIRGTFYFIQAMVVLLLLFLVVQGFLLRRVCVRGTESTHGLQTEAIPSLTHVGALKENINLYRLRTYELMFVQEKDRAAKLAEVDALNRQNLETITTLKRLFPAGPGKDLLVTLENDLQQYASSVAQLRAAMEKDFEGAMKILDQQIPKQVSQLNDSVQSFSGFCTKLASAHINQTVDSFASIKNTAMGLGTVAVAFAAIVVGIVALKSRRLQRLLGSLVSHLSEGARRVNESGQSMSSSSQSLAEGASEQAAALEETSASLEEMSSMTKRNADNSSSANHLARQARDAAENGANNMQAMSQAMNDIKTSSDDIAKIIKTIDEIAFQTNILALNAAVEAARAGEAGMGFAVVADEVRNLAQRSAQAAKDTAGKIEGAITRISQGVDINAKVGAALNDIVAKVRQVDELVAEVTSASVEQSHGITQVNSAITQMDKITQRNAATAEESAAAARELNYQAVAMNGSVEELLLLVGTTKAPVSAGDSHQKEHATVAPLSTRNHETAPRQNGSMRAPQPHKPEANGRSEIPLEGDFKDF